MRQAAGYIVFHRDPMGPKFLLLRNAHHGSWSFPKGHVEPGEDLEAGALRELREETGITNIRRLKGFEGRVRYIVRKEDRPGASADYEKEVLLFAGEVATPQWTRSPEHDGGGWMSREEVLERLSHKDLRALFDDFIRHYEGLPA